MPHDNDTIELHHRWRLGPKIGEGGFGRVHEALADDGSLAVIKLVPKAPGASRELLFEPISGLPNIVPILDSGEWQEFYALVMPRADKSLRQHLSESGGKLSPDETVGVLLDVAEALASLEHEVVHRDLKPANILLYQGHWCLADFGIARYADATTAPDTHKYAFSSPYAAPEQWRHEHATPATDVYAFGVTAFELLQGRRPFAGPDYSDYREQHLHQPPPALAGCPAALATVVTECLYKPPQARPTPANIVARLRESQRASSPGAARLQAANQLVVDRQSLQGAKASAQQSTLEQRQQLFAIAKQSLDSILSIFLERVRGAAPAVSIALPFPLQVRLGDGVLNADAIQPAPANSLGLSGHHPAFDVIAYTTIAVHKPPDQYGYEGRSHSLWYCDAYDEGAYRWFEMAFMATFSRERFPLDPFAFSPKEAAAAFSPGISSRQVAWEPLPLDQGDEDQFIDRWLTWFAQTVDGTLSRPRTLPEISGGHHRRSHSS